MTGEILNSMSHGTGRRMSRSDCKPFADSYDYANLRRSLLVPSGVEDSSLRTDGLFAYRDLDECLALIACRVPTAWRSAKIAVIARLPNRSPIRRARIPASSSPQQFPQAIRILVVDRLLSNLRP